MTAGTAWHYGKALGGKRNQLTPCPCRVGMRQDKSVVLVSILPPPHILRKGQSRSGWPLRFSLVLGG